MHRAGVIADFCVARNADGRLRIYDFIDAQKGHSCPGHKNCDRLKWLRSDYGFSKCHNQQFMATLTDSPVVDSRYPYTQTAGSKPPSMVLTRITS
jgi:hypothetical protein